MSTSTVDNASVVSPGTSDANSDVVSSYSPQGTAVDDVMEHRRQVRARVAKLEQRAREQLQQPRRPS